MNSIVIDCGASFIKAALYVDDKEIINIQRKSPAVHKNEKITDPVQINGLFEIVQNILKELTAKVDGDISLAFCNEMHGFILADKDMKPVIDYISWQKEFGNIEIDGISSKQLILDNCKEEVKLSGMPLRAGLPSANLLYLSRTKEVDLNGLYFLTLGDYLIYKLSGQIPCCHPTNAAATGLLDMSKNDWNKKLISFVTNNQNLVFPKVGTEPISFVLNNKNIKCYPAIGDQQAALLGAQFIEMNEMSFNLGTGAQVSVLINKPVLSNDNSYQIRPYFNGLYLKTIPHIPSGRAINVFIRFYQSIFEKFGLNVSEDEIWKNMLESGSDGNLNIGLGFFENAVDNRTTGYIDNIGEFDLTFDNLSISVVEQAADNFIYISRKVYEPERIKKLIFSGGIARRINKIVDRIVKEYNLEYCVSTNDTLVGLKHYINLK